MNTNSGNGYKYYTVTGEPFQQSSNCEHFFGSGIVCTETFTGYRFGPGTVDYYNNGETYKTSEEWFDSLSDDERLSLMFNGHFWSENKQRAVLRTLGVNPFRLNQSMKQ